MERLVLSSEAGRQLHVADIQEIFAYAQLDEQRIAIDALRNMAVILGSGHRLDNQHDGLGYNEHHWYGGPDNTERIERDKIARAFYVHPDNRDRLRIDVHSYIERVYGWPTIPDNEQIVPFLENSDVHRCRSLRQALERYHRG